MRALVAVALFGLVGCVSDTTAMRAGVDRVAYPNGKERFEFELRDGVPNGRGRTWHANGKLATDGSYRDGARHGRFWFYNDDGSFAGQAIYFENAEVWHSADEHARPPEEWTKGLEASSIASHEAPSEATIVRESEQAMDERRFGPPALFATLDRTTPVASAGAQVGVGNANDLGFGAATRLDVFSNYRFGAYGVFAQLTETQLALANDMTLAGRREGILAGTYHRALGVATLSATGGLIAAVGNANVPGSVASFAGAEQRTSDAAFAIPAPFAIRTAASLSSSNRGYVVQADAGIDWLIAGDAESFDALARANIGVGVGSRRGVLTAELDNSVHLSGSYEHIHTFALGGTLVLPFVWLGASLGISFSGTTSLLASVGHAL